MATAKTTPKKKTAPKTAEKKVATAKAVAPKKEATKKATSKKSEPKKPSIKKAAKNYGEMSGFERYKMIEVAAYYMAEKHGFAGHAADYWIAAENEIDKILAKK